MFFGAISCLLLLSGATVSQTQASNDSCPVGASFYEEYPLTPIQSTSVGTIDIGDDFFISFDLVIHSGFTGAWRNILHIGDSDHQRSPAIFLSPNSNQLHIIMSDNGWWNRNYDFSDILSLNTVYNIKIIANGGTVTSYLDNVAKTSRSNIQITQRTNASIYVSDPWYNTADVTISSLFIQKYDVDLHPCRRELVPQVLSSDYQEIGYADITNFPDFTIYLFGALCAKDSTIKLDNKRGIYASGHLALEGASITCPAGSTCTIHCASLSACSGATLECSDGSNSCSWTGYFGVSTSYPSDPYTVPDLNNAYLYSDDDATAIYRNSLSGTNISNVNNVYCLGSETCQSGTISNILQDIFLGAYAAGEYSTIDQVDGNVYAVGHGAGGYMVMSNIKGNIVAVGVQNLGLSAIANVSGKVLLYHGGGTNTFTGIRHVYISGDNAYSGSVFTSNLDALNAQMGTDFDVFLITMEFENPDESSLLDLICSEGDECHINCLSKMACAYLNLDCRNAICYVYCGADVNGNDCPDDANVQGRFSIIHSALTDQPINGACP